MFLVWVVGSFVMGCLAVGAALMASKELVVFREPWRGWAPLAAVCLAASLVQVALAVSLAPVGSGP